MRGKSAKLAFSSAISVGLYPLVIPAQAGIQTHGRLLWIPGLRSAAPGMTTLNPSSLKMLYSNSN